MGKIGILDKISKKLVRKTMESKKMLGVEEITRIYKELGIGTEEEREKYLQWNTLDKDKKRYRVTYSASSNIR